ncbi:MAG: hypothetical protein DMF68_13060 [Acidobacteria bacterium]|nr:MAG: hypothetical protein DMF68_13060 [Acidobacteriota bacterium]
MFFRPIADKPFLVNFQNIRSALKSTIFVLKKDAGALCIHIEARLSASTPPSVNRSLPEGFASLLFIILSKLRAGINIAQKVSENS